jgi:hypothetical protein
MKRLPGEIVQRIIFRHESEHECASDLAEYFGVPQTAVDRILELREPTRDRARNAAYSQGRKVKAHGPSVLFGKTPPPREAV